MMRSMCIVRSHLLHVRCFSSSTLTKPALARIVATEHELSQAKSERIVDTIFDSIVETVAAGDSVRIGGFGSFDKQLYARRRGRNPNTGEEIIIPETHRPKFKSYPTFQKIVKNS
eukprot:CAMPEP_0195538732 /NCGR_PEP_ID=MMETSP0794_2-20130614/49689_1 /TAXON_ID=515487 /ORGANISM="Stephanopyxis turris, Strain CCMP 815" /LENGTH=114 /DNA_ID=CAMNT_0040672739 /DNA_START=78 /DNA_END=422 /DNA_ORIENTATION=-